MIISQRIDQGTQRLEIVGAEQGSTPGHPLEVVHRASVRPRTRNTAQRLGIHLAAHHCYTAHGQVRVNAEHATQPRVEWVRHLHNVMEL